MSYVIALFILAILAALATAGFFMLRKPVADAAQDAGTEPKTPNRQMARALSFRIGLSVLLFICILIAWTQGWVTPKGVPLR